MTRVFFPDIVFAWVFCACLILLTCIAAYTDTKKAIIPNRLNVLILILGLVANAVRGGWLASENKPVWWLWQYNPGAAWLGAIDGFLFAVVGFVVVFAAMFLVWIFGLCGGGDVKLLAAVGGWLGPDLNMFRVWLASVVVLFVWTVARVFSGGISPRKLNRAMNRMKKNATPARNTPGNSANPPKKLRVTYSVPIAVATTIVLLWVFRFELRLDAPKPPPAQSQGTATHVGPSPPIS